LRGEKNKMTQNEVIDPSTLEKPVFPATEGLGKIAGQPFTVIGFFHTRGKPNPTTSVDRIGQDGKTDYYTFETEEKFNLDHKGEGVLPISHFYSTEGIHKQMTYWFGSDTANGKRMGPFKVVKRKKTEKPAESYWTLISKKDPDF